MGLQYSSGNINQTYFFRGSSMTTIISFINAAGKDPGYIRTNLFKYETENV
jgi:hypothetical protein